MRLEHRCGPLDQLRSHDGGPRATTDADHDLITEQLTSVAPKCHEPSTPGLWAICRSVTVPGIPSRKL